LITRERFNNKILLRYFCDFKNNILSNCLHPVECKSRIARAGRLPVLPASTVILASPVPASTVILAAPVIPAFPVIPAKAETPSVRSQFHNHRVKRHTDNTRKFLFTNEKPPSRGKHGDFYGVGTC
jgi:hypothetical protein